MRNTKLLMRAVNDEDLYMASAPGIRSMRRGNKEPNANKCNSAMYAKGRTAYHMLYNPIGQASIEGMRCENTR